MVTIGLILASTANLSMPLIWQKVFAYLVGLLLIQHLIIIILGPPDGGIAIFYPAEFNTYYQWDKKTAIEKSDDSDEQGEDGAIKFFSLKLFMVANLIYRSSESIGMQQSVEFVLQYLLQHGPFDGLMGFSQGAAMVTRMAMLVWEQHCEALPSLRFLILIGGVQPMEKRYSFLKVKKETSTRFYFYRDICKYFLIFFPGDITCIRYPFVYTYNKH